jgi:hypothetical protein
MADKNLRATQAQLCDALGTCTELKPIGFSNISARRVSFEILTEIAQDPRRQQVVAAHTDRSRRPYRCAHQLPFQVEN